MHIVLATPLFPPDTGDTATYVKELSKRLGQKNKVTVLIYGHLPESVSGTVQISIDKRDPLLIRLFQFTRHLFHEGKRADILYVENGASTELPVLLFSFIHRTPFILHIGDTLAEKYGEQKILLRFIHSLVCKRATALVRDIPKEKPEILPFSPEPTLEIQEYERSWQSHLEILDTNLLHV